MRMNKMYISWQNTSHNVYKKSTLSDDSLHRKILSTFNAEKKTILAHNTDLLDYHNVCT